VKKRVVVFGAILLALLFVSESMAGILGDQIKYGKLGHGIKIGDGRTVVHPTFDSRATYDTNIFMDPTNTKSDFYFDFVPGIEVKVPFSKHLFTGKYSVDFSQYLKYNTQNSQDQLASTGLIFDFDKVYVKQNNRFIDTASRSGTEFTSKVQRRNYTADILAGANFNLLTFEGAYSYFLEKYVEQAYENLNRHDQIFTGSAFYRIFPKTELIAESDVGIVRYDTEGGNFRDNNYYRVRGGVRGKITNKLTGIAKVGWILKDYRQSDQTDFNSATTFLSFIHDFTDSTKFAVMYERAPREATFGDNNWYLSNRVTFQVDQKIMNKLDAFFKFAYDRVTYPEETTIGLKTEKRKDNLWTFNTGLNYTIQEWITAGIEYEYATKSSDFEIFGYDRHLVISKLNLKF